MSQIRAEDTGVADRIHLNNAGAALPPRQVVSRIVAHLELESRIGGYEAAAEQSTEIEAAYAAVGQLVGVSPNQVAFVENATAAYAQALSAIPFGQGDLILTSEEDYSSNQIMFLSLANRLGIRIKRIASLPEGGIDLDQLEKMIESTKPKLLALTHVPTNSGLVQPVEQAGMLAREHDVLFLVDACQSVGQIPIDFNRIGADFLTSTSRKFLRGPRGSGFMAVSQKVLDDGLEPLFIDMRGARWSESDRYIPASTATRFENWEFAYSLLLATGEAARYAQSIGIERIAIRSGKLAKYLRSQMTERGFRVLDRGRKRCAIVTIEIPGIDLSKLVSLLRKRRVNTSASLLEYGVIDFSRKQVTGALRLSPHYYNTHAEIDQAVAIICESINACR